MRKRSVKIVKLQLVIFSKLMPFPTYFLQELLRTICSITYNISSDKIDAVIIFYALLLGFLILNEQVSLNKN